MGMMVVMLIRSEVQLVMALHFRLRLHRRQSFFPLRGDRPRELVGELCE
jgi:hypothetical protein